MNVFERIDASVLSFFTNISHKFQRLTGRTNFFLANICLIMLSLFVAVNIVNYWVPLLNTPTDLVWFLLLGLWIYWISSDKKKLAQAENAIFDKNGTSSKIKFNLASNFYLIRLIMLTFAILILPKIFETVTGILPSMVSWIFETLDYQFPISMSFYYYLIEVTPLPPGKSKIRQWLESFGKVLKPIPVRSTN